MRHLVFYDGECGLCDRIVQNILKSDKKKIFGFAPLQVETAKTLLSEVEKNSDSMILIENFQTPSQRILLRSKAALRTFWLLGGAWAILGSFYFVTPAFFGDFFYNIVAKNRHRFFPTTACVLPPPGEESRFLK